MYYCGKSYKFWQTNSIFVCDGITKLLIFRSMMGDWSVFNNLSFYSCMVMISWLSQLVCMVLIPETRTLSPSLKISGVEFVTKWY